MLTDTPIAFGETLSAARALPDSAWMARTTALLDSPTSAQWVAETRGHLVGTMGCFLHSDGFAHVVCVYIAPAFRGTGLLDTLFAEAEQWARERNVTTISLTVAKENTRAVRAYARRGFVPSGHTHPHPLYPQITEMEMTRSVYCG
jgi:GNAT superfamily N-acetyltransferase